MDSGVEVGLPTQETPKKTFPIVSAKENEALCFEVIFQPRLLYSPNIYTVASQHPTSHSA